MRKTVLFLVMMIALCFGQSVYRIRMSDSTYTAKLRGVDSTRTEGVEYDGSYDGDRGVHEFQVEQTGFYQLWVDPAGGSTYSEDTGWKKQGLDGKVIIGSDIVEWMGAMVGDTTGAAWITNVDVSGNLLTRNVTGGGEFLIGLTETTIENNVDIPDLQGKAQETQIVEALTRDKEWMDYHFTPEDSVTLKTALERANSYNGTDIRSYYITSVDDTLTNTIELPSNSRFVFSPNCEFFFIKDSTKAVSYPMFKCDSVENVIVDFGGAVFDGGIDSTGVWNMWDHFFHIRHSEKITLENFNCKNFAGDVVYGEKCSHVNISRFFIDCLHLGRFDETGTRTVADIDYLGRNGIAFVANSGDTSKFITVTNGFIRNGAPAALDFEPNAGGGIENVNVSGVICYAVETGVDTIDAKLAPYGLNVYCGATGSWARNIAVDNCLFVNYTTYGVNAYGDIDGLHLNQVIADGAGKYGFHLGGTNTYLSDCTSKNNGYSGLKAYGGTENLHVVDSKFHDNGDYGVDIHGGSTAHFNNVYLQNVSAWDNCQTDTTKPGIYFQFVDTMAVEFCKSHGNYRGFTGVYCDFLKFTGNWSFNNTFDAPSFTGCTNVIEQMSVVGDSAAIVEKNGQLQVKARNMKAGHANFYHADSVTANLFDAGKGSYETTIESWFEILTFECNIDRVSGGQDGSYSVRFTFKGDSTASIPALYLNDSGTGVETGDMQVDPYTGSAWKVQFYYKSNNIILGYLNRGKPVTSDSTGSNIEMFTLVQADDWTLFEYEYNPINYNPYIYFYIRDGDSLWVDNMQAFRLIGGDVAVNGALWVADGDTMFQVTPGLGGAYPDSIVNEFNDGGEAKGKDRSLGNTDAHALGLKTNDVTRIHITSDGKIGFGTTTIVSYFNTLFAGNNGKFVIGLKNLDTGYYAGGFYLSPTGDTELRLNNNYNATKFVFTSNLGDPSFIDSGPLGVGLQNPWAKIHVKGRYSGSTTYTFAAQNSNGDTLMTIRDDGATFLLNTPIKRDTLTLTNADKIFILGDSFLDNGYWRQGRSAVAQFAEQTNFYVEDFSRSGAQITHTLERFQDITVVSSYPLSVYEAKPKFVIVNDMINDRLDLTQQQYEFGYERLINEIQAVGSIPIITTAYNHYEIESTYSNKVLAVKRLGEKYGLQYIDMLADYAELTRPNSYTFMKKLWAIDGTNYHSNECAANYFAVPMLREFKEKPTRSIKIWRPDAAYTTKDTLTFGNLEQKLEKWNEIYINSKYGYLHVGGSAFQIQSEYGKLINGTAVSFSDFALIQVTFPYTQTEYLKTVLSLSSNTYSIYALQFYSADNDTADWSADQFDLSKYVSWDSLGNVTGTEINLTVTDLAQYINDNTIYLLLKCTGGFNMTNSPMFIFERNEDIDDIYVYHNKHALGNRIFNNIYFNAAGLDDWTVTGADVVDADTLTWSFPISDSTVIVYAPVGEDSIVHIADADTIYRQIDVSNYDYGKELCLKIVVCNNDTGYNSIGHYDVTIMQGTFASATEMNRTKLTYKLYPTWMPEWIYFRKFTSNTITVMLTKNDCDIYVHSVELFPVDIDVNLKYDDDDFTLNDNDELTIGLNAIDSNDFGLGSVTSSTVADSAIISAKIKGNAITSEKILNGTITADDVGFTYDPSSTNEIQTISGSGAITSTPSGNNYTISTAYNSTSGFSYNHYAQDYYASQGGGLYSRNVAGSGNNPLMTGTAAYGVNGAFLGSYGSVLPTFGKGQIIGYNSSITDTTFFLNLLNGIISKGQYQGTRIDTSYLDADVLTESDAGNGLGISGGHILGLSTLTADWDFGSSYFPKGLRFCPSGTRPSIEFYESDGSADQKYWEMFSQSNAIYFRTLDDSKASGDNFMRFDRQAGSHEIDDINFLKPVKCDTTLTYDGQIKVAVIEIDTTGQGGWVTTSTIFYAGDVVLSVGVQVTEAFDDSGADILDIGWNSTIAGFINNMDVSATGMYNSGFNYPRVVEATETVRYSYDGANDDFTAGAAKIVIQYQDNTP